MSNYLRMRVAGGSYFFTVNLLDRYPNDLLVRHVGDLREAVRRTRRRWPFHIDAWVVMPDHMHAIWTLPAGDDDFANRWRVIKQHFSRAVPNIERRSSVRVARGERGVWQRRFWEHAIRDDADYANHMDYIHFNPVKHGYVQHAADWRWSTFHRCVAAGIYPSEWAAGPDVDVVVGERE